MAFLNEEGDYAFIGLVPGVWTIRVDPLGNDFDPVTRDVVLPDAGRLEHVDFALPHTN